MKAIILLALIFTINAKTCLETYSCFNSETQCKKLTDECMNDQACLNVLISPDSCLFDCTKGCLKDVKMPFPLECVKTCIPQKGNQKYSDLMNCKLSACASELKFLENEITETRLLEDDCAGLVGVWKGEITYPSYTDHWIMGCTGQTTMTVSGSNSKFFFTMDVKCPGTINGQVGPYCNSYCGEGAVRKIGSCNGGNISIPYFEGVKIGTSMVLTSQEGTMLETRITLDK